MYNVTEEMNKRLENEFTYHAPKGDQQARYVALREKTKELAFMIVALTPPSREQSLALTELKMCNMMANSAIAINE